MFRKIKDWFLKRKQSEIEPEPEYIIETIVNPYNGTITIIELVCTCGWPVAEFASDKMEYWCEHCDRVCPDGLPTCSLCVELYMNKPEEPQPEDDF